MRQTQHHFAGEPPQPPRPRSEVRNLAWSFCRRNDRRHHHSPGCRLRQGFRITRSPRRRRRRPGSRIARAESSVVNET